MENAARLKYRLQVFDRNGRRIKSTGWRRAHSFVKQYYQLLRVLYAGQEDTSIVDVGGVTRTQVVHTVMGSTQEWIMRLAPGSGSTYGLILGSGTTAVAIDDNALETPIEDGEESGKLSYGNVNVSDDFADGTGQAFVVSRVITNLSGDAIPVSEAGLYAQSSPNNGTTTFVFCIVRDVFDAVVIPDGASVIAEYLIKEDI